jgi:hypothetical protein
MLGQSMNRTNKPVSITATQHLAGRLPVGLLLFCGILAFVLYISMDLAAALRYEGYSYKSQTISELSAVDAPTRTMWLWLAFPYEALVLAFGAGVILAAGTNRWVRIVGVLVVAYAIVGLAWPFAPMHQREVLAAGGGDWRDTMHLVLAGVTSLLFLLIMGFGSLAFGKAFRLYTFATIGVLFVFGAFVALQSPSLADNESTPWLGITERINVFSAMLWMAVFAGALLRRPPERQAER